MMIMRKRLSEMALHGALALVLGLALSLGAGKAAAWSLEDAAKPYAGTEVRGICDGYAPCMAYIELTSEFEALTGIKVKFEVADLQAIQTQFFTDQITGSEYYDLVEVISFSSGVFPAQNLVHPYSDFTGNAALRDPEVDMHDDIISEVLNLCCVYDGVQYAVPTKFVMPFMIWRKDLVNDEERANFKARYGYDMQLPPSEFQHFYDLAEFYTRKKGDTVAGQVLEKDLYGTLMPFKRHLTVLYNFERVLLGMGTQYVNEDGTVAIDEGDTAVKALEYYLSMREFSPPGYMEGTWDEEYSEMCNGNLFINWSWTDTTPYLEIPGDCPASAGNLGYGPNLGSGLTQAEAQGWYIPKSAQNPDAAFLFVQWLQRRDIQAKTMPMGGNPSREDVLRMPEWQADDWVNRGRDAIVLHNIDNDLLYVRPNPPAWLAWSDIIMEELSAAGAGYQDAQTTIGKIAAGMREAAGE
jgi:multiple sugar transport system substrate-binding protein